MYSFRTIPRMPKVKSSSREQDGGRTRSRTARACASSIRPRRRSRPGSACSASRSPEKPWSSPRPAVRSGRSSDSLRSSPARGRSSRRRFSGATRGGLSRRHRCLLRERRRRHLGTVLPLLNEFARVPVSGLMAQYNGVPDGDGTDRLPVTMRQILSKRLTVRGFINYDFAAEHYADFLREVGAGVAAGRIRYREDIVDGLEEAPGAFIGMLEGRNFGKLIVRVAP